MKYKLICSGTSDYIEFQVNHHGTCEIYINNVVGECQESFTICRNNVSGLADYLANHEAQAKAALRIKMVADFNKLFGDDLEKELKK